MAGSTRGAARGGRGKSGNDKEKEEGISKKDKALEELRKQVRELKRAVAAAESAAPSPAAASEDDEEGMADCEKSLDDLVASLAALTKSLGPDDPATVLVAARVHEARQRRDADKPLAAKVRTATWRRDKAQKQLDKAAAVEAKARAKLEEAQQEATLATEAAQQARLALARDEAVLADLQNALAHETSRRAKEAGYCTPEGAAPELLVPAAAALLAGCQDPKLAEALQYVAAKHREFVQEQQAAGEATATTAGPRGRAQDRVAGRVEGGSEAVGRGRGREEQGRRERSRSGGDRDL